MSSRNIFKLKWRWRLMTIDIHRLIAAINPDIYCDPAVRGEVKRMTEDRVNAHAYVRAAKVARLKESNQSEELELANPFKLSGLRAPIERHTIVYDSMEESLERIYFFILDWCENLDGWQVTKIADNSAASPGSGLFGEMTRRKMQAQDEWRRLQAAAQALIRSIVGQLAELRLHRRALDLLRDYESGADYERKAALLALKQIWLDRINATGNAKYQLNPDDLGTFLGTQSSREDSLSDDWRSVLRHHRLQEFQQWLGHAEQELRMPYNLARNQLRQDVETLKLYARWAAPYLRQTRDLEQNLPNEAALATVFDSAMSELVLLAQGTFPLEERVQRGELPQMFLRTTNRIAKPVVVVEFNLRMAPKAVERGSFVYRGRAKISLSSYALTDEELTILIKEIARDELRDLIGAVEGRMAENVDGVLSAINEALGDEDKQPKTPNENETNPFTALFSLIQSFIRWLAGGGTKAMRGPKPDSDVERVIRSESILQARYTCRALYDAFKRMIHAPTFELGSHHAFS